MLIDKVKNLGSAVELKKTVPTTKSSAILSNDNVQISEVAKYKADVKSITAHTLSLPNSMDINKLNEIKAKLASGHYDTLGSEVLDTIADKIADSFLGK